MRVLGIVTIFLFSTLMACKKQPTTSSIEPEKIATILHSYTKGIISTNSVLKFVFTDKIVPEDAVGKTVEEAILNISPKVDGQTFWDSPNTLIFKPTSRLKPGTTYNVHLALNKIKPEFSNTANDLAYSVSTRALSFVVSSPKIDLTPDGNYELTGEVELSDVLPSGSIEQLLSARLNETPLTIQWKHQPDMDKSTYTISKLSKGKSSKVSIKWDGKHIHVSKTGEHLITLPDANVFSLINVEFVREPQPQIVSTFSDFLKTNQTLDGLIELKDKTIPIRHVMDQNKIYSFLNGSVEGDVTLNYSTGITAVSGAKLTTKEQWKISVPGILPMIRFTGKGNILPVTNDLILPFEAMGLKSVDVEVFKILDHNILQFLQVNQLNEENELYRVGRLISQKKLDLDDLNARADPLNWAHFAIDLNPLIKTEPNAIYQIRLGFKPAYTYLDCINNSSSGALYQSGKITSFYEDNYYGPEGYYEDYEWSDREDPCKPAYYNNSRFIAKNVLVSNFGIIGKASDKSIFTAVTDVRTTDPIPGAQVDVYNFQLEKIAQLTTDAEGIAQQYVTQKPYAVVVSNKGEKGYLRMADGYNLNMSAFDIDGAEVKDGVKGFVYTERGIWRPGDSIHLNFILNNFETGLPPTHPVQCRIYDVAGRLVYQKITSDHLGHIYSFKFTTSADAPTGIWKAIIQVGDVEFSKNLSIEAIKPNRLKINFDLQEEITTSQTSIPLNVTWLTGLPASGLKAKVVSKWSQNSSAIGGFKDFVFNDPARNSNEQSETILYEGDLTSTGDAMIPLKISSDFKPAGKMNCRFNIEVSEPGGDFSTFSNSAVFHPYKSYAGIKLPTDPWGYKSLSMNGAPSSIQLLSTNTIGKALPNRKLSIGLYELDWQWWWEQNNSNVANFNTADHKKALQKTTVTTNVNGLADWKVQVPHWGRYMIRVCDVESGHCAGDFAYAGWPEEESSGGQLDMASLVRLQTDKEKYKSTETVQLNIPAPVLSKMLITLETGSKVIESHWVTIDKSPYIFQFQAAAHMSPTIYAHVALLQPYGYSGNDFPIRMYGVLPIQIENGDSKLNPLIQTTSAFKPDKIEMIEISEADKKPMDYTLAIVDEGLLDLTNFKTPDPHQHFFAKEALGVRTWDVYDYILGAYGGKIENILSIGGDEGLNSNQSSSINRFKSPVIHLGPYHLNKGEKKKHNIQIKNYIGSVRIMVVASGPSMFGQSDKTIPVKSDVMLLPTLPRLMSINEKITMPVNLFLSETASKNVQINVRDKSNVLKFSQASINHVVNKPGEDIVYFEIQSPANPGIAKVELEAKSGSETFKQELEIEIRNPNPYSSEVSTYNILPGKSQTITMTSPKGSTGTKITLEVASFQPVKLGKHLDHLLSYPYGCAEQTISAAFPQLYLDQVITMSAQQIQTSKNNVQAAIKSIQKFNLSDGSFSLWPGTNQIGDTWVTSYVGHFLIEAQKKGFITNSQLMTRWRQFQKKAAGSYNPSQKILYKPNHGLDQAYRLYTLALAGQPELAAMNRLKEYTELGINAKWRLACAYALAGQADIAKSLITKSPEVTDYTESGYTYGSALRDQAMILETFMIINDNTKSATAAIDLTKLLNSESPWNTQGLAYGLQVLSKFIGFKSSQGNTWSFSYRGNKSAKQAVTVKTGSFLIEPLMNQDMVEYTIENTSSMPLYVEGVLKSKPMSDVRLDESNQLKMTTKYVSNTGGLIDPGNMKKGDQLTVLITVTHPGIPARTFKNLALNHTVPAGWEIINQRLMNNQTTNDYQHQDIRDDRIATFFELRPGESKTFTNVMRATYAGEYTLPAITCEEMYDPKISARVASGKVLVY